MRTVENIWEFWTRLLAIDRHCKLARWVCQSLSASWTRRAAFSSYLSAPKPRLPLDQMSGLCTCRQNRRKQLVAVRRHWSWCSCTEATVPTVQLHAFWILLILLSKARCFQVDMMDDEELLELVELETREMTGAQYTWFFLWLDDQLSHIINVQSVSSPQLGYTHTDNHWRSMVRLSQYGFPGDDTPFIQGFPNHVKLP